MGAERIDRGALIGPPVAARGGLTGFPGISRSSICCSLEFSPG
jgi:hypothetical protein